MDSDVYTASYTFQIMFTPIWCKKIIEIHLLHFYYNYLRWAYKWFAHLMNSDRKTLIPMSKCYLFLPQAACWAAGRLSAVAWQVIDIKELRDSEVVVRQWSDMFFMKILSDIFVTLQASKPVWVCVVYVSLCLELHTAWLVGGLIGKSLHDLIYLHQLIHNSKGL